jgi:hypothetical protein
MSLILIGGKYMSRNRKITIQLFFVLFVASILMVPTIAGAATSSRTMPTSVDVNSEVIVSVAVSDYGLFGKVVETIPYGFTYVISTLDIEQVIDGGNTITFGLMGESTFEYTIIAPTTAGSYAISGIVKDENGDEFTIGGGTSIIVGETAEQTNDSTPDEQTSTPSVPAKQTYSEPIEPETIDEIPDEPDVNDESSKSVKTTPSTESTEEIPASEATPFITTFGMIVIGVIATLVHKIKH